MTSYFNDHLCSWFHWDGAFAAESSDIYGRGQRSALWSGMLPKGRESHATSSTWMQNEWELIKHAMQKKQHFSTEAKDKCVSRRQTHTRVHTHTHIVHLLFWHFRPSTVCTIIYFTPSFSLSPSPSLSLPLSLITSVIVICLFIIWLYLIACLLKLIRPHQFIYWLLQFTRPRVKGYSFAIRLPSVLTLQHDIKQFY